MTPHQTYMAGDGCLLDSQDSWRMRLSRRHRPLPFSSHAQADTTTNGPQPIIRPAATNDSVSPPKRVQ